MVKCVFVLLALSLWTASSARASDWAGRALGAEAAAPTAGGPISTTDLLRLRELGALSISPDGRRLAFSVREGDAERNRYALRWFVMPTDGSAEPAALAMDGGQPIPAMGYGLAEAFVPPEPARWSPDNRRLAFRRLVDGRIELWVADLDGGTPTRVADGAPQVDSFGWRTDGALEFRTGLNGERFQRDLEVEARNGWLQDERVAPFASHQRPGPPDCAGGGVSQACEVAIHVWQPDRPARLATPEEQAVYPGLINPRALAPAGPTRRIGQAAAARPDGALVWSENADPKYVRAILPVQRIATNAPGAGVCAAEACTSGVMRGLGWARNGATVWFLRGESGVGRPDGAPYDLTALYEWEPTSGRLRRVWRGEDLLNDCVVRTDTAFCARETASRPAHVVAISLDTGALHEVADPNPQFAAKSIPQIRKIPLAGLMGNPAFAHLVFPIDYQPGRRYPLVIVQYLSKGFLWGGVGHEVPIFPLSANGFMVLSLDRPMFWTEAHTLSKTAFDQFLYDDHLRDRRNVMRAIDSAVDRLVAEGLVAADRVAITGLSSGAEIVHYALQRSDRYAAAIASSGAHDLTFLPLMPRSPERARRQAMFRAATLVPAAGNALYDLGWSQMPERLRTPLLINAGEYEALLGFEGLESLKEAGRPLEVRVFPDEFHFKYHPRSFAGVYENGLNWLCFWLKGEESADPRFQADYARWRGMRARLQVERASRGLGGH